MTGIWAAYRDVYDSVHATSEGTQRSKQLFDIGAAIADKKFSLATSLTEKLREETVQPGQVSLGWAPTMAVDVLIRQLREVA